MKGRAGSTLVELLAVLAIMAVVASVVTLAIRPPAPRAATPQALLADARRQAIGARHRVTVAIEVEGDRYLATALPDGGVVADSLLSVDRLTGQRLPGARR